MPNREWTLSVKDIFTSANKILAYAGGINREEFFKDTKTYDAVLRNLGIIGEAAKNIPNEIREKYTNVEWKKMAGLRDVTIHQYFGINEDVLWDIVSRKIPELQTNIAAVLNQINVQN